MAWHAMVQKMPVTMDLIIDPAMYLLIESDMRRGICMINKRHTQANIPPLGKFNPEQPLSYIVDWDANNL